MPQSRAPAPPPRWMVTLNVVLLRRGLSVGSQHLLEVSGRRSGIVRSTPVSIVTVGGERYIVAAFADADWVKNVRAAGAATLRRGSRSERITLTELPAAERAPVLRAFPEQVRGGVRFFGTGDSEEIVRQADRYPVFRIEALR
jgi:deazaflavin-dependent oxidoreductase (nitroreductase family)